MSNKNKKTAAEKAIEEAYIAKKVKEYQEKQKEAELDAAVRNAIMDAQRNTPGYKY